MQENMSQVFNLHITFNDRGEGDIKQTSPKNTCLYLSSNYLLEICNHTLISGS
jgi:hypothetical protein